MIKNSILHKIIYKFHKIGFYFYSVKYYYEDHKHNNNKIKIIIKALINNLKIFKNNTGYFEYLEIPLTTKCTLKCKKCSNLIPCYKNPKDYDINTLINSIKIFLRCINNIVYIRLLGGEPFLSNNVSKVLKVLLKSNKIQRIEIVTNGTIIPKEKSLISLLKNNKIIICISDYPFIKKDKLISFLKENNIKYRIDKMNYWIDYGNINNRKRSKKELKKQFHKCNSICKSLINGQLHLCPRSSHGTELQIIKNNQKDYVNLLDGTLSIKNKKKRVQKLLNKKYIKACNYCNNGTKYAKKIKVAEQIKKI